MKLSEIPLSDFLQNLKSSGARLRTGPFQVHLQTPIAFLGRAVHLLYSDFQVTDTDGFADFHMHLREPNRLRRFFRPQVCFYFDDLEPFKPLPRSHAFAMFEWCLNWCIESHANHYLLMHAAIIERDGCAAILAAPPGGGKSTLTAALINVGWRLLSDELTMIDPSSGLAISMARPVSLKNESIDVIRDFVPEAVIGPVARDTVKGSVAHMKPPTDSVKRVCERALPRWVIFCRFEFGASVSLIPCPKGDALLQLADHAFNYSQFGVKGYEMMVQLIDRCESYSFTYSRLDDAIRVFDSLARR